MTLTLTLDLEVEVEGRVRWGAPARLHGHPDSWSPEEGDEVEIERVTVGGIELPDALIDALGIREEIEEALAEDARHTDSDADLRAIARDEARDAGGDW